MAFGALATGGAVACIAPCHDFSSQNLEMRASVLDVERPDGVSTADDANGRQGRDHARGVQGWVCAWDTVRRDARAPGFHTSHVGEDLEDVGVELGNAVDHLLGHGLDALLAEGGAHSRKALLEASDHAS